MGFHNKAVTTVITEQWTPLLRTTALTDWSLVDEIAIPATQRIIVWAQGYGLDGAPQVGGFIRILVDDVQKLSAFWSGHSMPYNEDYSYGATSHYTGPGGTVKCEVKTADAAWSLGGRRGMYSISF